MGEIFSFLLISLVFTKVWVISQVAVDLQRKQKKRSGFKKVHIVVPAGNLPREYFERCNDVARRLDCTLTRLPASPIN